MYNWFSVFNNIFSLRVTFDFNSCRPKHCRLESQ